MNATCSGCAAWLGALRTPNQIGREAGLVGLAWIDWSERTRTLGGHWLRARSRRQLVWSVFIHNIIIIAAGLRTDWPPT